MPWKTKRKYKKYSGASSSKRFTKYSTGTASQKMEAAFHASFLRLVMRQRQLPPFPQIFELTGRSGGMINNLIQAAATSPGTITDHIQVGNSDMTSNPDWGPLSNLYDMFRVIGFSVEFWPYSQANNTALTIYAPLFIAYDPDDNTTNFLTIDAAMAYETKKTWDLTKHNTFTAKVPKMTSFAGVAIGSLYGVQVDADGFADITQSNGINWGAIKWYGEQYTTGAKYGYIIVKWLVAMKYRR